MIEEIQYILWRKKGVESEVCVVGGWGGGLQPNKTQQSGISAQQRYRPAKSLFSYFSIKTYVVTPH